MRLFQFLGRIFLALSSMATAEPSTETWPAHRPVSGSYCPPRRVTGLQQRRIFDSFVDDFLVKKDFVPVQAKYIAEDYIQHTPSLLSGRQANIDWFKNVSPASLNFTILKTAFDNGIGWVHYRMDMLGAGEPFAVVDMVRFNGSCIQEHWDVVQQRQNNSVNPLALF
ncbi:hypothetical protein BJX99DRAFT_235454 [Aspergillus californicus]